MELKIDKKKLEEIRTKSAKIEEGNPLRDKKLMSLFAGEQTKIPLLTLNAEQFAWPETFLVRSAKRVDEKVIDYETGWSKKGTNGKYFTTGNHNVQLILSDGDTAQTIANMGQNIIGLPTIKCLVEKDIPIEKFEENASLIKLVHPVVMLGVSWGYKWNHIKLVCEDVEF